MISVEEALKLVKQNTNTLENISVKLNNSLGFVLAEDIYAPISLPPFEQSAMDGYAIGFFDGKEPKTKFKLSGEVKAGDIRDLSVQKGEAMRIFTGARIPRETMSVIMQEVVTTQGDEVKINDTITEGSNIRRVGEQVNKGDIALKKNTLITPAGIGYLAGLGIETVRVYKKPKIGIIVTGNELIQPGNTIQPGQIYESNSSTLSAAITSAKFEVKTIEIISDDLETTTRCIEKMTDTVDLVIISGGISVGDYDFVGHSLENLNANKIFYKINQKPGKPIYFGKKSGCLVFALPGNPSASLLCFYLYVLPAMNKMSGNSSLSLEKKKLISRSNYRKKGSRAHFLKSISKGDEVEILEGQSSAMLHTFAVANALVYVPADKEELLKGELVETIILPVN